MMSVLKACQGGQRHGCRIFACGTLSQRCHDAGFHLFAGMQDPVQIDLTKVATSHAHCAGTYL